MSLRQRSEAVHVFNSTPTAAGTATLVSGVPGTIIRVYRAIITLGTVGSPPALVQFNGSSSGVISSQFQLPSVGQLNLIDGAQNLDPLFSTVTPGEGLQLIVSGGNFSWDIWHLQAPA